MRIYISALIAVICLRIVVPLLSPIYPLLAWLGGNFLDILDFPLANYSGWKLSKYELVDKILDSWQLLWMVLTFLILDWPGKFLIGILAIYRLIGTIILLIKGYSNEALLMIFPNVIDFIFFGYALVSMLAPQLFENTTFLVGLWVAALLLKFRHEYILHIKSVNRAGYHRFLSRIFHKTIDETMYDV